MTRTLLFASLLLFATLAVPCRAQDSADTQQIKSRILAQGKRIQSIDCDFLQVKKSVLLDEDIISNGHMKYAKPQYLEWKYDAPLNYSFVFDSGNITINNKGRIETFDSGKHRFISEMSKMILSNIEGAILSDTMFRIEIHLYQDEIAVDMFPLRKDLKKMLTKFVMRYNGSDLTADSFEVHETNGDLTVIMFKNCKYEYSR